jgi:hypothetical protein
MRHLIALSALSALSALAIALVTAGTAGAGGWATVGLASLPNGIEAGETWRAQITVLRHGVTPTDGAKPSLTIRNAKNGETASFDAKPTGETGVYEAAVVFPEAGEWRFAIDNGLAATGYGESATTTYGPVIIQPGPAGGADTGSFPTLPAAALAAALALLAAAVLGVRRMRRPMPASR